MNELDYYNRTNTFFTDLYKRHKVSESFAPIIDSSGAISKDIDETLKNWTEYYKKLYSCNDKIVCFPNPDTNELLDGDLE